MPKTQSRPPRKKPGKTEKPKPSRAPQAGRAPRKREAAASEAPPADALVEIPTTTVAQLRPKPAPPPLPPPPPNARRVIFIDVENTSSENALLGALGQLDIDRSTLPTELVAVGNWRVIGQHVARTLAQRGARLLHTAPATGVKDWSDLSIAVASGIWLGRAQPGDRIEIISADRAFDAVADAAANLGVVFRRLTYGPTSGLAEPITPIEPPSSSSGSRRRRRGGRSRRRTGLESYAAWAENAAKSSPVRAPEASIPAPVIALPEPPPSAQPQALPPPAAPAPASNGADHDPHGASHEQVVATIARLTARAPERGVNLDLLINALKAEGFGRPPGSPRLVTRLRKMKDVEVSQTGMVRLLGPLAAPVPEADMPPAAMEPTPEAPAPSAADAAASPSSGEEPAAEAAPAEAPAPKKRPRRRTTRSPRRSTKAAAEAPVAEEPQG